MVVLGGFTVPTPILETRKPRLSLLRATSVRDGVRAQTGGHGLGHYSHQRLGQNSKAMWFCCCAVAQSCPTRPNPKDCSTPGAPVLHSLSEFAQTHVHWVGDAIQSSHPLSSPSRPSFNLYQHQSLFQWVSYLHQVAKVLELQFQYQSFQWIVRVDFL